MVNKADRPEAATVRRDLRSMLALTERASGSWRPPVLLMSAQSGEGVDKVAQALADHVEHTRGEQLDRRRRARARAEVEAIALAALRRRWGGVSSGELDRMADEVATGRTDPYAAADRLLDS